MSETVLQHNLSLDDYQKLVEQTWRKDEEVTDWSGHYAQLVRGELMELDHQHGISIFFFSELGKLKSEDERAAYFEDQKENLDGIIEELGDILWFNFRIAAQAGLDPKKVSAKALGYYTSDRHEQFTDFSDVERAVSDHGDAISVPSKSALRYGLDEGHWVSIDENPAYVMRRMVSRLARSLEQGSGDVGPFTASMLEPVPEINQSIGDCINTIAYVAHHVLGVSTSEVAARNIDKLQKRLTQTPGGVS